jgi:hypothetical protein
MPAQIQREKTKMTPLKGEMNMQEMGIEALNADESLAITGGGYWERGLGILCAAALLAGLLL